MEFAAPLSTPTRDPIDALVSGSDDAVLAVITGVEGPSYRPVGACMAIFDGGERAGTLSSGCIEQDLALHAADALLAGTPVAVRYGRGSPFMDIQLPCGGGLDILLVPRPDRAALATLATQRANRSPASLRIDRLTGTLSVGEAAATGWRGDRFLVRFDPAIRFVVFGKGPEACTFAALVRSAGYPNLLLSPDEETLEIGAASGCDTQHLRTAHYPDGLKADPWTAVILFFHDHDWEPPILEGALRTPAFYIGSQGSQRARDTRLDVMRTMGIDEASLARLHGPVGLIPSARDAGTLAVSVLAEVLAKAMAAPHAVAPATAGSPAPRGDVVIAASRAPSA